MAAAKQTIIQSYNYGNTNTREEGNAQVLIFNLGIQVEYKYYIIR